MALMLPRLCMSAAGLTAEQAAVAAFELEGWDIDGFPTAHRRTPCSKPTRFGVMLTKRPLKLVARTGRLTRSPLRLNLELLIDHEAQLADRDTALAKLRAIVEAKDDA
ncbi:hypothetical protein [Mesorhizobium sp.]|uniref:hypothetical protein n=1 Tax=Mesorhizobium sp. TaxID=1871066 RepID=UPI000FE65180|nr:hypothetical protein [Mesorhizobium sp.]RWK65701.1 MAG: hypothetical protein EOR49_00970 [Mesorhizobium sp.]RWK81608.1 MAG: hypothetical protein EOR45_31905 [Mesorhizobium sp.]RWM53921.1 MAG: hypothetical protein EOR76_01615 [Mesorhizobium sp.]RWM60711.1 MAG: hypothetical protein EOR78_01875 [Mesorhizobium sp.]RWM62095.1 MAG: hypothetical protein EOR79_00555 [Mesorhizobium sp.]